MVLVDRTSYTCEVLPARSLIRRFVRFVILKMNQILTQRLPSLVVFSGVVAGFLIATSLTSTAQNATEKPADTPTEAKTHEESLAPVERFLRVRRGRDGDPVAMETSVTRYVGTNAEGQRVTVDLIGVVHIGERKYYESLNELFGRYDALLYELVAPEGTVIPKGGRGDEGIINPIAAIQKGMQSMLGLEFQLDHIDYTMKNFVHADMSPDEFLESMKTNDESFFKMALKAIGHGIGRQSSSEYSDAELLMAMFSGDRTRQLRRIMATQMKDMEGGMEIFEGKDGSTIINHRNRKAFDVLKAQIAEGKQRLGVFYGAGHLPDMDELLLDEHGLKRGGQYWFEAWDLR